MEINLNCDLGEKSNHYDGKNDYTLLNIINSANIACGYHAGDKETINKTILDAKKNNVSVGAHPGFNDKINFGRKKIYLTKNELINILNKQLEIISEISIYNSWPITHVKPHGALNNMACEDIDIALTIGQTIKNFNKDFIYVVLPLNEMEKAAQKIDIKYACEIFADRNYEDNGQLISRKDKNASINDPDIAANNILEMLENSYIKCLSGKKIKTNIDTVCIHGDGINAVEIARELKKKLEKNNFIFVNLNKLKKFI
tara:strand:- start:343 stop:1116 length:774 start_codon:yes stop_codon:yes gene_type:complete